MPYTVIDEGEEPDLSAFDEVVGKALQQAAYVLQRALATPPPKAPGTKHLTGPLPGGFYSERQRKFVIGGIRSGLLKIPYLRTGNLPRSWSVSKVEWEGKELTVWVYSDPTEAPYNEWVQQDDPKSKRQQVAMHQDWNTPEEVEKEHQADAMDIVVKELKKWGFSP